MTGLYDPGTPIPATPPLHGLAASAQEVTDPERWDSGFTICPENCVDISGMVNDCWSFTDATVPTPADPPANQDCYDVDAYTMETSFRCNARGFQTVDYRGRARRQLEAATSKFMEHELWTGTLRPDNPRLDMGGVVIGPGPYTPSEALVLLGQALSNCAHGGRGMIHAPTFVVDAWLEAGGGGGSIKEQGTRLVTVNRGDTIVSGTGYPGTGPEGVAPGGGQAWVWATGPVQYRLGSINVIPDAFKEAFNKRNNLVQYHAQREAAANFDPCCHFGLLVQVVESGS